MGYTLGPVLGGILTTLGGYPLLFATLGLLAFAFLCWAALTVPALQPLPRARQTVLDLARGLSGGDFLRPTLALAATIAALSVGVGFLPVTGADRGLGALATGAVVSLLAAAATLAQPWAGRLRDNGRISDRHGMTAGLLLTAAGFVLAVVLPGTAGLVLAAPVIGLGAGLVATIGFAHLAATSPLERLGQTMGAAEVGRELGDAGGPLLVGAIAAAAALDAGLLGLATLLIVAGVATAWQRTAPKST